MGDILFDRYRICRSLGRGTFGEVFLAEHTGLHVYRAVKCISKSHDLYEMAYKEADILKNLRHPGIPIIYDIIEDDNSVFIIEEFMSGQSLNSFLHNRKNLSHRFIVDTTVRICEIVDYLHSQKVYHLDIKPDNILISGSSLRIIDYGSSKYADTEQREIFGTKGYAAPEMYNYGNITAGTDIYSIGIIILFMCTGNCSSQAREHITSDGLRSIVDRCTSHNTKERYNSVSELKADLLRLMSDPQVSGFRPVFVINFTGAQSHIGTTHCALMLQSTLMNKGLKCLIREKNSSHDIAGLIRCGRRVYFKSGVYWVDGRYLAVNSNNKINYSQIGTYDVIINDYGCFSQDKVKEIYNADIVVLVTGARGSEMNNYCRCIKDLHDTDPVTFINFSNAKLYRAAVKMYEIRDPVRIPYDVGLSNNRMDISIIEQRLGIYGEKRYRKKNKYLHNDWNSGNRT